MVNPNEMKIPIVQKTLQNLGAFLDIFFIKLFNLFVLNIASKGKKRQVAPSFFLNKQTNARTTNQKIKEKTNQGLTKKSKMGELNKDI